MLAVIYIASASYGVYNFFKFRKYVEHNQLVKGFLAFVLALVFCHFQLQRINSGEAAFTFWNLFSMTSLVAFHIGLWSAVFDKDFGHFLDKVLSFIFCAVVIAGAAWLFFASFFN